MKKLCWWLVDHFSRSLDPNERDAVFGDFAELGIPGSEALWDLLGLLARRQAALWKDWRPWLALLGIAVPVGFLLTQDSHQIGGSLGRQLWTKWQYGVRYETGLTPAADLLVFACGSLALISSSWVGGFALGSLSRRALWVNAFLFYSSWLLPLVMSLISHRIAFFWLTFFVLPSACFFVLPSASGMRQGLRRGSLSLPTTISLATIILALDVLATWTESWWSDALVNWSQGTWHAQAESWPIRLLPLVIANWPLAYLLTTNKTESLPVIESKQNPDRRCPQGRGDKPDFPSPVR